MRPYMRGCAEGRRGQPVSRAELSRGKMSLLRSGNRFIICAINMHRQKAACSEPVTHTSCVNASLLQVIYLIRYNLAPKWFRRGASVEDNTSYNKYDNFRKIRLYCCSPEDIMRRHLFQECDLKAVEVD